MMEPELCSSRISSNFREESGDEELTVLPRHTKVIVTGNNRTKSVLVGLQGVVKKATVLGGWHWLVLKNGVEVKLQRNALSVLEHPTGLEDDDNFDLDNSSCGSDVGEKDYFFSAPMAFSKPIKPRFWYTRPWDDRTSSTKRVNFAKLGTNTLWRYYSTFKLGNMHSNPSKEHLVNAIQKHFASQQVSEVEVIMEFINAAKRQKPIRMHRDRS